MSNVTFEHVSNKKNLTLEIDTFVGESFETSNFNYSSKDKTLNLSIPITISLLLGGCN